MKIAIIADTHGNVANFRKIIEWLKKENIKIILHCGDIGNTESLKESLAGFGGEFFGVLGNMDRRYNLDLNEYQDPPKVKILAETLEAEIGGKKIAVTHFPETAQQLAGSGKYDLVFYGHTHRPWKEKVGSCRVINPGEAAGQYQKPTFAVYDTEKDFLELKILEQLS